MAVIRKVGEVITKEREEVARRLLRIFSTRPGGCVEFLNLLTHYEIMGTGFCFLFFSSQKPILLGFSLRGYFFFFFFFFFF